MNITKHITGLFGSKMERDIKAHTPVVAQINEEVERLKSLSDEEIQKKTEEFKERLAEGETLDDLMVETYAVVKDVCQRLLGKTWEVMGHPYTWDMVPYDVQLVGAIVLHQGKITEMATGEGKSLVATMPLYLNALTGNGVHFVTVNDYLVRRDVEWYGPIYQFLGLTVDYILHDMDFERRHKAYIADITYGTNNEFGFDYLRDNMAVDLEDLVQRGHHYALVDEVDSVLIDEARTPLIISGPVSFSTHRFDEMKPLVLRLVRNQTELVNRIVREGEKLLREDDEYMAGIKLLQAKRAIPKHSRLLKLMHEEGVKRLIGRVESDYMRDKRMGEIDADLLFAVDEKFHTIDLTEKGISTLSPQDKDLFVLPDLSTELSRISGDTSLTAEEKTIETDRVQSEYALKNEKIRNAQQLLKAYTLFEKDVEYVVQDDRVMIVDEFTGRLMPGRRYSDGLHQALEAKENVKIERETQTLATITLQNYFRLYNKLAGMTGTAETEATEFFQIYKLDVVVIPTNEPVRRVDYEDHIYRTRREKYNSIIKEIIRLQELNRPVLVGTVSVEVSETLSRMLKRQGVPHNVLNAKYHQQEAEIIVRAGQLGAVTIATNMAGRGTDIKLGKGVVICDETCAIDRKDTSSGRMPDNGDSPCYHDVPCGLHIIGTARHEARRIDRQLRGRAGRQGDPGSSKFYLSLEDDLMRLFGSERIAGVMDRLGIQEGEVITHGMVTKAINRAQQRVEAYNFDIRKHLLEYDDVMNQQREVIYDRRHFVLENDDVKSLAFEMMEDAVESIVERYADEGIHPEDWDMDSLRGDIRSTFLMEFTLPEEEFLRMKPQDLAERLTEMVKSTYESREAYLDSESLRKFEKAVILSIIDEKWKEHLFEMDILKEGIGLRAYGQKDPLLEYKSEAFELFVNMLDIINVEVLRILFRQTMLRDPRYTRRPTRAQSVNLVHEETMALAGGGQETGKGGMTTRSQVQAQPAMIKRKPVRHKTPKVGRNDPCPCGSGKKYKKCCMLKGE